MVAFRALGVCLAHPLWLWALCSCRFFPWCQGVVSCSYLVALRAVGCRVCVHCLFPPPPCVAEGAYKTAATAPQQLGIAGTPLTPRHVRG